MVTVPFGPVAKSVLKVSGAVIGGVGAGFGHADAAKLAAAFAPTVSAALPGMVAAPLQDVTATGDTPHSAAPRFPVSVPLILNGRYEGDLTVEADMAGGAFVDVARFTELLGARLTPDTLRAVEASADGASFVSTERMSTGGLRLVFDSGGLKLDVETDPSALGQERISLTNRPTPDPAGFYEPADVSFGVGATVGQTLALSGEDPDGPIRGDIFAYGNLGGFAGVSLFTQLEATERVGEGGVDLRRGVTQLVHDRFGSALRFRLGDVNPPLTGLQAPVPLLGLSVERDYRTIRPFQNLRSAGYDAFALERDARVEVYVNDVFVEELDLRAGRYEVGDFPSIAGANDVRLVIEDGTGTRELASFSFYSGAGLLAEGLTDFAATLGVRRRRSASGFSYVEDDPYFTGFVERGVTSRVTAGINAQASSDWQTAGASIAVGTPIGVVETDILGTRAGGRTGWGVQISHAEDAEIAGHTVTFSTVATYLDEEFGTAPVGTPRNRLVLRSQVRADLPSQIDAALSTTWTDAYREGADRFETALTLSRNFDRLAANATARYIDEEGVGGEAQFLFGISYRLSPRWSARASYATQDDTQQLTVTRSRPLGLDTIGAAATWRQSDRGESQSARVQYRGNRLEFGGSVVRTEDARTGAERTDGQWQASSFLGMADGRVAIGRPAPNGFAIVGRHRSLKSSKIEVTNGTGSQIVARTDRLGAALVPELTPYLPRRLVLGVDQVPTGYDIGAGGFEVLPSVGIGYQYTVGSDASRTVLGRLNGADGEPITLAVGVMRAVSGDETLERQFFTSRTGRFVAEKVAAGTYELLLDGRVSEPIEIGEDTEGMVDVGTVTFK